MSAAIRFSLMAFAALAAAGCSGQDQVQLGCASDAECADGQVCFPDGCGDPGRDIAVEVVPGATSGQLAQDFRIDRLQPVQNLEAFEPAVVLGMIQQEGLLGVDAVPYAGEVVFRAYGHSTVIPGRTRSAQYTVLPDQGAYEVPIPTGTFAVTYTAKTDPTLPPARWEKQLIQPGQALNLTPIFPHLTSLARIDGRLVRDDLTGEAITQAVMEVQAFEPTTGNALSQPATVAATGDFSLFLDLRTGLATALIRARPQDPTALVPSKTFDVSLAALTLPAPLEMGDFGTPIQVTGRIVDSAGLALAGVDVFADGRAEGEGTFRTAPVTTDALGVFSVATLRPLTGSRLTLWAIPSPKSAAGVLRLEVAVPAGGGSLGDLRAPDKVQVSGRLLRPDGSPGGGVVVEAEAVEAVDSRPLPLGITRGVSDAQGAFALRLDPAVYRLDFVPLDLLPRVSRFATVTATPDGAGKLQPIALPDFTLSNGRRVTGTISSIPRRLAAQTPVPAPYASVKFFRVVTLDGKQSSVLLAETVADDAGNYSVLLPAAETAP